MGQKVKRNINKEFLTYLVFLFIAVIIWYLNALNEDYTAELKFAVKYTDLPEDKVLANVPPERLFLTINAHGFTLLKYRLGMIFSPIAMEASYNTLRRKSDLSNDEYYIVTQSALNRISAQLRSDIELRYVYPDTLNFVFTETINKDIFVKPAIKVQYEKGFLPKGSPIIEPQKVTVTGPKTVLDTMQFVYTRTKLFKNIRDTLRISIDLQPVQQLRYSANEVNILQAIQRYTEASIVAPIDPINMPEGMTMIVFPGSVTVNCLVPVADYEKLQPYMFRAVVDYNSVKDAADNQTKARVAIIRTPDYVTNLDFHPNSVDFIIEK